MKRVLAVLAILLLAFVAGIWFFYFRGKKPREKGPKPVPLAVSKHSDAFNSSMAGVLGAYYEMTEDFVIWDSNAVRQHATELKLALDSLKLTELQKDEAIYLTALEPVANAKMAVTTILEQPGFESKRVALNSLSDNIRNLLVTVRYDREKMYWQECPMAFGEEKPGNWLSKTDAVRNPYLGTMHPDYKAGMLNCGAPKDTINFVVVDTTNNK
jgi:hypothetical protein